MTTAPHLQTIDGISSIKPDLCEVAVVGPELRELLDGNVCILVLRKHHLPLCSGRCGLGPGNSN
jgi:hypothetical protein